MSLLRMAWRYVWGRPLVTVLTLVGIALGAALICSVLTIRRETERTFLEESALYDLVVGAKGSPLQLVLSSVYHLDIPTGNIPWSRYEALATDNRVRRAVPIGLGDNYKGFRIVGTNLEIFSVVPPSMKGLDQIPLSKGRYFDANFEAVIGAEVARQTGLQLGDTFAGAHGLVALAGSQDHDEFPYTVVGVLEATGASIDRAVYTTLESVWLVHESEKETHRRLFGVADDDEEEEEEEGNFLFGNVGTQKKGPEVTAVLVQLRTPGLRLWMSEEIKNNTESMAAIPINEMFRLYRQILAPMQRVMLMIAAVVVVVSALTVLTTLYQAAERRRRDIAVMRALGARAHEIFAMVLLEAVFLVLMGIGAGWLLGHGFVSVVANRLRESSGVVIAPWSVDSTELYALGLVAIAGLLAGLVPALLAYRRSPVSDIQLH